MRGERKRTWREEDDGRLGEETLRNILSKSLPRIVFCFVFDNLWFSLSLSLSFFLRLIAEKKQPPGDGGDGRVQSGR